MAKICAPYGCSPPDTSSLISDCFADEFYISPDSFELLGDMPTICGDIQKMESDMDNDCYSYGDCGLMQFDDIDIKPELRNTDLMWWSKPVALSTSASSISSDITTAAPLSAVMGNQPIKIEKTLSQLQQQQEQQKPQPTVVTARKFNQIGDVIIKKEHDLEEQLNQHSIPNLKMVQQQQQQQTSSSIQPTMQNLPAGTSLLRKSANQQQKKLQQSRCSNSIPKRMDQLLPSPTYLISAPFNDTSSSSLNTSNCSSNISAYMRPDTPHSLDDDSSTPEFRHNVDLRACVMGSNNISLTADPTNFINHVSQELQDTSKKEIGTRLNSGCTLNDVLDVINSGVSESTTTSQMSVTTSTTPGGGNYSHCLKVNTSGSLRSSDFDSDDESTAGSSTSSFMDHEHTYGAGGVSPVSSQSSNISSSTHNYMQHSDHSYTRCKDGMDDISTNFDTPSDSEEEIDVVSINDKKLPTNPSDKDRRVLQTKVAHKFNARIVKTPNGIRTIPPRRRGSYELPYTPASNSPVKSVNNSRFPSPAGTPYQNQYTSKYVQQQQQQMMSVVVTDGNTGTPLNILTTSASDKSRKRLLANAALTPGGTTIINGELITNAAGAVLPPNKKHRGKKTKHIVTAIQLQPAGTINRSVSLDETADTIEKRNLHNDMERQRRIGLKNLFEALKKQIPSIKDKERAPKVNILREAAKLCEALTREDAQLCEQKAKLKEELRRKQELLNQLRQRD
ncbi:bHLH transcription factor Myc [Haematobia irritans]|uniref:bHLH transcription factor Myc n=1 Tax=Haematobia irritans TaxID=7368 RepID=UPI003F5018F0